MAASASPRTVSAAPAKPTKSAYNFRQLEELWLHAGGDLTDAPYAAAIALAESKGEPGAEDKDENGSVDRGLWQINSVHGSLSTFNVAANAKAAVQIQKESGGFGPWVTFKSGAYKAYLTPANLLTGVKDGEALKPQAGLLAAIQGKIPGFSEESGAESAGEKGEEAGAKAAGEVLEGFSWGGLKKFSVTAVLLLVGAGLLLYGIIVMVRPKEGALAPPKLPSAPIPVPI